MGGEGVKIWLGEITPNKNLRGRFCVRGVSLAWLSSAWGVNLASGVHGFNSGVNLAFRVLHQDESTGGQLVGDFSRKQPS